MLGSKLFDGCYDFTVWNGIIGVHVIVAYDEGIYTKLFSELPSDGLDQTTLIGQPTTQDWCKKLH